MAARIFALYPGLPQDPNGALGCVWSPLPIQSCPKAGSWLKSLTKVDVGNNNTRSFWSTTK